MKRPMADQSVLDQRFNKILVTSQIQQMHPDLKKEEIYRITDNLHHEWTLTNKLAEYRARFFKSRFVDALVVVSKHSTSYDASIPYEQVNLFFKGSMFFAIPMPAFFINMLGGPYNVVKIICIGGLPELIKRVKNHESFDDSKISPSIFKFLQSYLEQLEKDVGQ